MADDRGLAGLAMGGMDTEKSGRGEPQVRRDPSDIEWQGGRHDWVLQKLHEVGRDIGSLQSDVSHLQSTLDDTRKKVEWLLRIVFLAMGALAVIWYVVDAKFEKILDILMSLPSA